MNAHPTTRMARMARMTNMALTCSDSLQVR